MEPRHGAKVGTPARRHAMSTFLAVLIGGWSGWLATYWWFKGKEEENNE